jgi:gamma-polyglutamate biosynthesis protein CapC
MTMALAPDVATLVLALGLVLSLACYVASNISPGGMITPGWIALTLVQDVRLAPLVLAVVLLTYASARGVERIAILYGKRLFASVVLLGAFYSTTALLLCSDQLPALTETGALGLVAPGLIAYQLIRHPLVPTLVATAATTSVTYALVLAGVLLGVVPTLGAAPSLADLRVPALEEAAIGLALAALAGALALLARLMRRIDWASLIAGPQPAVAFAHDEHTGPQSGPGEAPVD